MPDTPTFPLHIRGAVLERSGDPRPYADSAPITISDLELSAPGPAKSSSACAQQESATPTSLWSTTTGRAHCRCCSGTKHPASSKQSVTTSAR